MFNSLPNDKILEWYNMKAFADNKFSVTIICICDIVEKIVGKVENAVYQHFLLFPQSFPLFRKQISNFESHLFCHLQMHLIWTSI